jgi:hypothetical protein
MKKSVVIGIIFLSIGTTLLPPINGTRNNSTTSDLQMNSSFLSNVTIIDTLGDVCTINYTTQETEIITTHPDIEVENIDIKQTTYTQQEIQATVSLQVVGIIEDRGQLIDSYQGNFTDLNFVEYDFTLTTSEQDYTISYANQTGLLSDGIETVNLTFSDFSVVGDTLTIWFSLHDANETYEDLIVTSMFVKINFTSPSPDQDFVYLTDIAPNPPLEIMEINAPPQGYEGQVIQFEGSVIPMTGLPPYTYHWDFGDGTALTQYNPTHIYTTGGIYTCTLTVIDNANATASKSRTIIIQDIQNAFIIGTYTNFTTDDDFLIFQTVDMRLIAFKPFQFLHYLTGEEVTVLKDTVQLLMTPQFILGMVQYVAEIENDRDTSNLSNPTIPNEPQYNPLSFFPLKYSLHFS